MGFGVAVMLLPADTDVMPPAADVNVTVPPKATVPPPVIPDPAVSVMLGFARLALLTDPVTKDDVPMLVTVLVVPLIDLLVAVWVAVSPINVVVASGRVPVRLTVWMDVNV
jgi:hypothetical protein